MPSSAKYFVIGIVIVLTYAAYSMFHKQNAEVEAAKKSAGGQPAAAQAASPNTDAAGVKMNGISKSLADQGATICINRITQVTNFIGTNENTGAYIFPHLKDADSSLLSTSMEIAGDKGSIAYASANFAPSSKSSCAGEYEAVAYWPEACDDVVKKEFKNAKVDAPLKKNIGMVELGPTTRVFLMSVDKNACVSIKKEIVF